MKNALKATLTLIILLAIWWVLLRLALPYLSYERIIWTGAGFFFFAGIVVILRARRNMLGDEEAQLKRREQTIQGCFYLAVAVVIAIANSLVSKSG
jgi:hypothetical protein